MKLRIAESDDSMDIEFKTRYISNIAQNYTYDISRYIKTFKDYVKDFEFIEDTQLGDVVELKITSDIETFKEIMRWIRDKNFMMFEGKNRGRK